MKNSKVLIWGIVAVVSLIGIVFFSSYVRATKFDTDVENAISQTSSIKRYDEFVSLDMRYQKMGPFASFIADDVQFGVLKDAVNTELKECANELTEDIAELKTVEKLTSYDHYLGYWNLANDLKLGETMFEISVRKLVENYNTIAEYQSDLDDLLESYKVQCSKCAGRGIKACSKCHGVGSSSCSSCNGMGKKLVTWYSEGDWGAKSYTSYECKQCNGRGRQSCSNCDGGSIDCGSCESGFKYVFH